MFGFHLDGMLTASVLSVEVETFLSALTPFKPLPFGLSQVSCLLGKGLFGLTVYRLALHIHSSGPFDPALGTSTQGHPSGILAFSLPLPTWPHYR